MTKAMKKVLIGTVVLDRDTEMHNASFSYAADFEDVLVPKGEYPIFAYEVDIEVGKDGGKQLGRNAFFGYEGTVLRGSFGGVGTHTSYNADVYDYELARMFIEGHDSKFHKEYRLRPEWYPKLVEAKSILDGRRIFTYDLCLKDGAEMIYME